MKHQIDAEEADFIEGFYYRLPLVAYAGMPAVSPLLAARLLCAQKPMYDGTHDNEEVKILAPVFEDIAQFAPAPRSMLDWVQIAQTKELAHSEDIAAYLEFRAQENAAVMAVSPQSQGVHSSPEAVPSTSAADASSATPAILDDVIPLVPVPRSAAQNAAIVAALRERGYDPKALPVVAPGRAGVKAEIKKILVDSALFKSKKIFDKAWERLRAFNDICDAS